MFLVIVSPVAHTALCIPVTVQFVDKVSVLVSVGHISVGELWSTLLYSCRSLRLAASMHSSLIFGSCG